ncbi:MAG: acyl-CoA dehydratase activase [Dissulfuribacterales bacterium]
MKIAGLDVGSRAIKLVLLEDGILISCHEMITGFDYVTSVKQLLEILRPDRTMLTGYGRHILSSSLDFPNITEIKAHARGVHHLYPEARSILDIGGQDTKAIGLTPNGTVQNFVMNNRCAAGTGRFLEVMANSLQCSLDELNKLAMTGSNHFTINSTCTVFAETEVISLKAQGAAPQDVARAVFTSVAQSAASLLHRLPIVPPLCFCGGVARNQHLVQELERILGMEVLVPKQPEFTGALGAALLAVT